ncbi:MAG: formate--tetrahydrofolate ligase [Deltaproteobacteria bacterium]|nr:formate--tetrahydrofolate ligase [Deltaproteobacteria bacterium]
MRTTPPPPLKPIEDITNGLNIPREYVIPYGRHIAKIDSRLLDALPMPDGKLVLITSMTPALSGEGKTTLTIGLTQAFRTLGKNATAVIRQPSLGPLFGAKGGATGSGLSMAHPSGEISMHFTGDDSAVCAAHNLISALIDNHIYHGNPLGIKRVLWPRVSPINDRALRNVLIGSGSKFERQEEFHISAASEVMSILSLSIGLDDLMERIGKIIVAFDKDGIPVRVADLKAGGAATALLKNALHPNLVQSTQGAPVFVHTGPFGNVSIGCSSLIAAKLSLRLSDYTLTEAGFSTELGAEKFFDVVCRAGGLKPSAAVIVATLDAIKIHGMDNLLKHASNIEKFGVPFAAAINRFSADKDAEIAGVIKTLKDKNIPAFIADVRDKGGKGGIEGAEIIMGLCERENRFKYLYGLDTPIEEKICVIAKELYGANEVVFTGSAKDDVKDMVRLGLSTLPVCVAKTPKSLSGDPGLTGAPTGFAITVKSVCPAAGAGFLTARCANILLLPGLPPHPNAETIGVDKDGNVTGI